MPITTPQRMAQKIVFEYDGTFISELSPIAGDLTAHYIKTAERSSFEQEKKKKYQVLRYNIHAAPSLYSQLLLTLMQNVTLMCGQ
ncbi:hypothetical protein SAMN05216419_10235 [Nitrosomonas cryotolerans]|uniref:Uncharacterized protein n=1 Tax=Nitrosomonas cryotolerans ATCC 49181 TaxID=1131553 RepID=A0A1N6I8K7_9PROT|nr:hypothetical protein SAMN05216419_10235 [Nitrosomonas cryotolerans]SIO28333.1 hypothetical protein SAMN02743940_1628 [Nitrosomonas cryotolerans ATCC 49181]